MRALLLFGLLLTAACREAEAPFPPPSAPTTMPPGFEHPIWEGVSMPRETPTRIAEPVDPIVPEYTDAARKAHIQGIVIVTAGIAKDGSVVGAYVIKGLPLGLDEKAVEAVEKAEFRPALAGDRPIDSVVNLTIEFRL